MYEITWNKPNLIHCCHLLPSTINGFYKQNWHWCLLTSIIALCFAVRKRGGLLEGFPDFWSISDNIFTTLATVFAWCMWNSTCSLSCLRSRNAIMTMIKIKWTEVILQARLRSYKDWCGSFQHKDLELQYGGNGHRKIWVAKHPTRNHTTSFYPLQTYSYIISSPRYSAWRIISLHRSNSC